MTGNPAIALLFGCDWSIFNERIKKQILRYNLLPFTDTNSVICKIIVGNGLPRQCAHWLAMTVVVGSRNDYRTSTSFRGRLRPWESVSQHRKRRKIYYEGNRNCPSC